MNKEYIMNLPNIDKMSQQELQELMQELVIAVAKIGKKLGYQKITDKTKWREPIMAGKLNHEAFDKISAGKNSDKYGADAYVTGTTLMAEYKSQSISEKQINNLLGKVKNKKTKSKFSPLVVKGVYNGAYTYEAVDAYKKHKHFFGVFFDEKCVMIIEPKMKYLIDSLNEGVKKIQKSKSKKKTTNCNTVSINLGDKSLYKVVFRDEEWFAENV